MSFKKEGDVYTGSTSFITPFYWILIPCLLESVLVCVVKTLVERTQDKEVRSTVIIHHLWEWSEFKMFLGYGTRWNCISHNTNVMVYDSYIQNHEHILNIK